MFIAKFMLLFQITSTEQFEFSTWGHLTTAPSDVGGAEASSMLQGLKPWAIASRHLWRPVLMVISQGV